MAEQQLSKTLARVKEQFADQIVDLHNSLGMDVVVIPKTLLIELMRFLRDDPELKYHLLTDLTAVDYLTRSPRFEVVYHLFSLEKNTRVRIKVPVAGPEPEVESITPLYKIADWLERECYDMVGIRFANHPDLRRILLYPEFKGHPLHKDYPVNKRQPLVGPQDSPA